MSPFNCIHSSFFSDDLLRSGIRGQELGIASQDYLENPSNILNRTSHVIRPQPPQHRSQLVCTVDRIVRDAALDTYTFIDTSPPPQTLWRLSLRWQCTPVAVFYFLKFQVLCIEVLDELWIRVSCRVAGGCVNVGCASNLPLFSANAIYQTQIHTHWIPFTKSNIVRIFTAVSILGTIPSAGHTNGQQTRQQELLGSNCYLPPNKTWFFAWRNRRNGTNARRWWGYGNLDVYLDLCPGRNFRMTTFHTHGIRFCKKRCLYEDQCIVLAHTFGRGVWRRLRDNASRDMRLWTQ